MPKDNMDEILQPAAGSEYLDPKKASELEHGVNQGVIPPTQDELAQVAAISPVEGTLQIINPAQNWDPYLSSAERQSRASFDTLGCNIFCSEHGIESTLNLIGKDPDYTENGKTELSSRYGCVQAGLNGNGGSSQAQYQTMINTYGVLKESLAPFPDNMSKGQFFAAISDDLKQKGKEFLKKYDVSHRQIQDNPYQLEPTGVGAAAIKEALKYGFVKIFLGTGSGWNNGEPKEIPRTSNPMNHAVMVRYVDDQNRIHIFDQYAPFYKVLAADYRIDFAFQTIITKKAKNDRGVMLLPDGRTEAVFIKISSPIKPISQIQNMPDEGLCLAKDNRTVLFYSKEGSQANIDKFKEVLEVDSNDIVKWDEL